MNRYPRASSGVGKSPRITRVRQDNPLPPTTALQRHSSTLSPLWTNTLRAFSGQRPTQLNDRINTQVFPGHQPQLGPEGEGRRVSTEIHSLLQAAKQTRQTLPPLSHAIARSQSEKALLPKQVALPGRGSVTGEVTPKHSQFIAGRQGTGAGLGAGGSQRAAEGSEEAAGDKDGTVLLSSSHCTLLPKATFTWRNPRLQWTEKSPCMEGLEGLLGHPNPAGPTDLLPRVRLWGQSWAQARARPPQRDGPRPRDAALGAEDKTHGTKRGESGHPTARLVIWSVNMAGGWGAGQEGQWQRIYIKIKGEEGRNSERERARSWLQGGYISLATSSLSATPLDRELWPSFSLFTL